MANALGKLELVAGNHDAAVSAFDAALELNPELLDSLVSKSMALYFNPNGDLDVANEWAAQVSARLDALGNAASLEPFKQQVAKIRRSHGGK